MTAQSVDSSLVKDHSPWTQRALTVLDEMISRGNLVAKLIKTELERLQDILNSLPPKAVVHAGNVTRSSHVRGHDGQQSRRLGTRAASPALLPPPSYLDSTQAMQNEFPLEELIWHDGFTAEELVNFADSMDLEALDWLSAEGGQ